jgi:hypothetical protein
MEELYDIIPFQIIKQSQQFRDFFESRGDTVVADIFEFIHHYTMSSPIDEVELLITWVKIKNTTKTDMLQEDVDELQRLAEYLTGFPALDF